jgi:hypothetical protein
MNGRVDFAPQLPCPEETQMFVYALYGVETFNTPGQIEEARVQACPTGGMCKGGEEHLLLFFLGLRLVCSVLYLLISLLLEVLILFLIILNLSFSPLLGKPCNSKR